MTNGIYNRRGRQAVAWAVASVFLCGFFYSPVGAWTGPIANTWFIGTQKPRRGFLWLLAFVFVPRLIGQKLGLEHTGQLMAAALLIVLPFLFHRLVSPNLPGLLSTLPLPFAAVALSAAVPASLAGPNPALAGIASVCGVGGALFLNYWFAAAILWMWNREFRVSKIQAGLFVPGAALGAAAGTVLPQYVFAWICLAGAAASASWSLPRARRSRTSWAARPESVARLRSPYTGEPLHVETEKGRETLASSAGERFPIREGIAVFLKPEDLTGLNGKYNRLYETIGGFYDDSQRVAFALAGADRDAYVMGYMGLLEVKPGDSVLETSVGTGLNFKYLPRGAKRAGLDLSPEMLANFQLNLRRWEMDADVFLGNAECLPFADSSFDVVFHVGGINFFNDRAKAVREMIRVAKPGSRLLIADETEEHVKTAFERFPVIGEYFKGRTQTVSAPIDLLPPEMEEVEIDTLGRNRFYVLTFRKPRS
jgi:ubiquinone/menaquinone biosynthesis C-methylase UbiE/uncharacterized protein YbaR (Trm112 family)